MMGWPPFSYGRIDDGVAALLLSPGQIDDGVAILLLP
jgi:hypothetical protein